MQRRFSGREFPGGTRLLVTTIGLSALCIAEMTTGARADATLAQRANEAAHAGEPSNVVRQPASSDYQPLFKLTYHKSADLSDCQAPVPPVGAISPFPLALRLGAMVSPRTKFDGGIDATIRGVHLIPGASTRVDLDAIVSVNFGGVSTLVPVTFDQIFSLNLPISSRIYVGGGIGPYFSDVTRFGGKLIVGAEFSRLGLEGNIHFSGGGDTLFTIQARIGL